MQCNITHFFFCEREPDQRHPFKRSPPRFLARETIGKHAGVKLVSLPLVTYNMPAFINATPVTGRRAFHAQAVSHRAPVATTSSPTPAAVVMNAAGYQPRVDEFMANDVRRQYIAKACPSGVPSLQCIEGSVNSDVYGLRTTKRQMQLRYRQLPTSVKVTQMYQTRKAAIVACHGCSHEENRVIGNPALAASMALGKAEADRSCNRYIPSSGPVEDMMCRSVENVYMKAVNGSGVFSVACTDGQAKYEAYEAKVRGGSVDFRAKQYSAAAAEGAKFAARKRAIAANHICVYEDNLYSNYPRMAGSMRPAHGYFQPFVQSPRQPVFGGGAGGVNGTVLVETVAAFAKKGLAWFSARSGGYGGY